MIAFRLCAVWGFTPYRSCLMHVDLHGVIPEHLKALCRCFISSNINNNLSLQIDSNELKVLTIKKDTPLMIAFQLCAVWGFTPYRSYLMHVDLHGVIPEHLKALCCCFISSNINNNFSLQISNMIQCVHLHHEKTIVTWYQVTLLNFGYSFKAAPFLLLI
jgi:hypothetical protein